VGWSAALAPALDHLRRFTFQALQGQYEECEGLGFAVDTRHGAT